MAKALAFLQKIEDELSMVEEELQRIISEAGVPVLAEASNQLLSAGGKRLRPAFAILSGRVVNGEPSALVPLAVALELIHMATLVHDDVVDEADTRRGLPTVRAKWGNQLSLHAGDYLFAKSLLLISTYHDSRIAARLAEVSVRMSEGEIEQMASAFNVTQSLRDYMGRIKAKTALLISASSALGVLAAGKYDQVSHQLGAYGYFLGMAFQITDDILDMIASEEQMGKPVASDLRQGILTLPAIYALRASPNKEELAGIISSRNLNDTDVKRALVIIRECGGLETSYRVAARYVTKAQEKLAGLPEGWPLQALREIAVFVHDRQF